MVTALSAACSVVERRIDREPDGDHAVLRMEAWSELLGDEGGADPAPAVRPAPQLGLPVGLPVGLSVGLSVGLPGPGTQPGPRSPTHRG